MATKLEHSRKQIKLLAVSVALRLKPSRARPDLNIDTFYLGIHLYIFYGAIVFCGLCLESGCTMAVCDAFGYNLLFEDASKWSSWRLWGQIE